MESEYTEVRLGDLVKVEHGWPFKSEFFVEEAIGGPIVVNIGNFKYTGGFRFESTTIKKYVGTYPKAYELSPGDLLLVMTCQTPGGEILGIPGRIPNDGRLYLHNQRIGKVAFKDRERLDPGYLYYLCLGRDFNRTLCQTASGTKILHTSPSRIEDFKFQLPAIAEQKRIANILGALDDKIELNRKMNETLEQAAHALFKSWFVDFDPVHAKVAGRQPVGMDKTTAELFPDSFVASEQGKVPRGWKIVSVGEAVECVGGATPSTAEPEYWEGGIHHWTTPKDFSSLASPFLLNTERKLTNAGISKISSGLLPAGTLLLSSRAPIGYIAIATIPVAINQGFIALKCNEIASNFFMLNWCKANMAEIKGRATGTTFPEISKQNFRPISVCLPPKELMSAFTAKVSPIYGKIVANLRQTRNLSTIRDTLLPGLLNGDIVTSTKP